VDATPEMVEEALIRLADRWVVTGENGRWQLTD
jgi:hypothetical protein